MSDICKTAQAVPIEALGNGKGGCTGVLKHKWFSGFDWDGLLNYQLPPPIPVTVKDPLDASNFDAYEEEPDTLEESEWTPNLTSSPFK